MLLLPHHAPELQVPSMNAKRPFEAATAFFESWKSSIKKRGRYGILVCTIARSIRLVH